MSIRCQDLAIGYGNKIIVDNINLDLPRGKIITFCGANGCGKSTLLHNIAGLSSPLRGAVYIEDKQRHQYSDNQFAKKLAMLPQSPSTFSDMTVFDVVKLGRYPHQTLFQQWRQEDQRIVEQVIATTGLSALTHAPLSQLSGGQRQRAWIALTLAQQSDIILLDEPINHLDMHHQIEVLDLVSELQQQQNKTIILVLHDINLAARYSHQLVTLANGSVYQSGAPNDIINEQLISDVFAVRAKILQDPVHNTPLCLPLGRRQAS